MPSSNTLTQSIAADWIQIEKSFSCDNYNNNTNQVGCAPSNHQAADILFCAPHALNHFRHGNIKVADIYTGSLCRILSGRTNQASLVPTCLGDKFYDLGLGYGYLQAVRDAAARGQLIVDLHGMSDLHGFDICIGTGPNPSPRVLRLVDFLVDSLVDYNVSVNDPFDAMADYTVTNYVQTKLFADALQIEIAARLRSPDANSDECEAFLLKLIDVFNAYISS